MKPAILLRRLAQLRDEAAHFSVKTESCSVSKSRKCKSSAAMRMRVGNNAVVSAISKIEERRNTGTIVGWRHARQTRSAVKKVTVLVTSRVADTSNPARSVHTTAKRLRHEKSDRPVRIDLLLQSPRKAGRPAFV